MRVNWELVLAVCALSISVLAGVIAPIITAKASIKMYRKTIFREDSALFLSLYSKLCLNCLVSHDELLGASFRLLTHFSSRKSYAIISDTVTCVLQSHESTGKTHAAVESDKKQLMDNLLKCVNLIHKKL